MISIVGEATGFFVVDLLRVLVMFWFIIKFTLNPRNSMRTTKNE